MPFGDLHNYQPPPGPHVTGILEDEEQAQPQGEGRQNEAEDSENSSRGALSGDGGYDHTCGMYKLHARRPYKPGEQARRGGGCHVAIGDLE